MHQQLFVHEPVSIIKHIIMKSLAKCILSAILLLTPIYATARQTFCLNSGWKIDNRQVVTLPHAWNEDDAFMYFVFDTTLGMRKYLSLCDNASCREARHHRV